MRGSFIPIALLALSAACSFDARGGGGDGPDCACPVLASLDGDCRLNGNRIGDVGATVLHGETLVTFESWVPEDGSTNRFVGFTISAPVDEASIAYTVKCMGDEEFVGSGAEWVHPEGTGAGHAINVVDLCGAIEGAPDAGPAGQPDAGPDGDGDDGDGDGGDGEPDAGSCVCP